jgi:hypothetical protein
MPSLPLALLQCMITRDQALVDPSSITIMIHTTLCVFNEHMLVVINNSFSSFSLDGILCVFMMLGMYNHIGHNVCLVKWIASVHPQDIYPVSHLAKLISSLIVLSFKHQNPQGGLDALSEASSAESIAPNLTSSNAPEQTDPSVANRVTSTNPSTGRHGRKRPLSIPKRK